MNNVRLKIYLDNKCNLQCEYCGVIYNDKPKIKEEDIKNFILNNKFEINFDEIELLGGEPSIIYSDSFLHFLNNNFKKIIITTNLKNSSKIQNIINICGNKCVLYASYNKEIKEEFFNNASKFIDNISSFSLVITKSNLKNMYENVLLLSKFKKSISLIPEISKNNIGYKFDKEELSNQFKMIFDNNLNLFLSNFKKIENKTYINVKDCNNSVIIINCNGELESCSYTSSMYNDINNYNFGNIFDTKLKNIKVNYKINDEIKNQIEKCNKCKKCFNYKCYTRCFSSKKLEIQPQICEFNQMFFDFAKSYVFKPNLDKITILLTEKCNMKCTYCFEKDFKNIVGNIDEECIKKSLDLLFRFDNGLEKTILFFGGEPTLNVSGMRYAFEYYLNLKKNGLKSNLKFEINTNLLSINDEFIDLLIEVGKYTTFYLSVSLDGTKEINDKQRVDCNGNGTYDKVINNVKKIKDSLYSTNNKSLIYNIKINKHTVLQNENIKYIKNICENAWKEKNLFDSFSLNYVTADKGEHANISFENLQFIYDYYSFVKKSKCNLKNKFILKYLEFLNLEEAILNNKGKSLCDLIDNNLSIRANGDIIPCHAFLDKIKDSNYNSEIKITNILDIEVDKFGLQIDNYWYKFINKNEKVINGEIKIISEYGFECDYCPFSFLCHTCIANLKDIKDNVLIKPKELCMRVLNQADILLKSKEINSKKILNQLNKEEQEKIDDIIKGIVTVGELSIKNKQIIDSLKGVY